MADEKKTNDFLATARKRFEQAQTEEQPLRTEAELDLRFVAGEQWDERVKADRTKNMRPTLTFNRMPTFVQKVANEARQMRGEIKFNPAEDGDKATAEVKEGIARHIQYNSSARVAYETAIDCSVGGSFGYFRFLPERTESNPFVYDLKVKPVIDPFSVYGALIPAIFGQEPEFVFVVESLTKEEYEATYPNDELDDNDWAELGKNGWLTDNRVRVAEYWYVERSSKTVYLMEDGSIVDEVPEGRKAKEEATIPVKTVKFCKINGVKVLENSETEWPGKRIPVFAVLGKAMVVKGTPYLFSVVRHQRDPQQLLNFYKSGIAERIQSSPLPPFFVPKGGVPEEDKPMWARMNTAMTPYLEYNVVSDVNGQPCPPPTRNVYEPPIAALSNAALMEVDEMKATAGIFDASLGNRSNENSGIALQRRQQESDSVNMHFIDNLGRVFDESGRELARVIPVYYDTARTVRILGADETAKLVKINQQTVDEKGQTVAYNIADDDAEKYDVVISMSRAYSTKRMESFDQMGSVIQAAPNLLPMFGDIYFKNSDMAGADEIAERFEKMLPPPLQKQPEGQMEIPPQLQQQMAQMGQQHQALNSYAQTLEQQLQQFKSGAAVKKMEVESRERIEMAKIQAQQEMEKFKAEMQYAIAEITAANQSALQRQKLEGDLNNKLSIQDHAQSHQVAMRAAEVGHEAAMAQANQTQEVEAEPVNAE